MRKRKPDFNSKSSEGYYDLSEDWGLIEASIASQYGIRMRQELDMPWAEMCTLIAGLMPDTPLGQYISIRSEKDRKAIKNFSPEQKRIHREWSLRSANTKLQDPQKLKEDQDNLSKIFKSLFSKEVKK